MVYRYILVLTIIVCSISAFLTGITYAPIFHNDKYINIGYYESFIFLIVSDILLFVVFLISFFIDKGVADRRVKLGMLISSFGMGILLAALIYCDFFALTHNLTWGESSIVWFLCSIPATALFIGGLVIFGWARTKRTV